MPKRLYNFTVVMWFKDLISILYPELLVLLALILAIVLSTSKFKNIIWITSIILMLSGCFYIIKSQLKLTSEVQILNGMFIADPLSIIFRLLTLLIAILIVLASVKYCEGFIHKSEFMILFLGSVLGVMFLVGANDLVTLFVALETLGLSSVMLVGYSKYDLRSNEASLKYLLNSASASAIFLFGLSILYGLTGTTQFNEIKYRLLQLSTQGNLNILVLAVVLILVVGGLAFKLASVPLHMWSPDVYEGAPTPVTAFLSVGSKAAAFAVTLRLIFNLFDFASQIWQPMLVALSILSMIVGNFIALGEVLNKASIKRLMAYSSISQVGYILIGVALGKNETIAASIFYVIVYSVMNLGAFLCIINFGNEANSDFISDYSGLVKRRPLLAFAFSVCLFNLAGLPIPPAGFIAKFILFKASFEAHTLGIILGAVAIITTILSIYYYSYIAKLMIVDEPSKAVLNIGLNKDALGKSQALSTAIFLTVVAIFLSVIVSNPLLKISNKTADSVLNSNTLIGMK